MLEVSDIRKRAPHEAYLFARDARALARPYQSRLSQWMAQQARLRAIATTRSDRNVSAEAEKLRGEAALAYSEFRASLQVAPEKIAHHSIARDLDRSFERLIDQLGDLVDARN